MALTKIGASLGGGADTISVTQSNHGLVKGRAVKVTGNGTYGYAKADTAANAEAIGIIIESDWDGSSGDNTQLLIALSGKITVDGAIPTGNLTAGTVVFLSATSNVGELTSAEPNTAGHISKPMGVITSLNSEMIMVQHRGEVISTAGVAIADNAITLAKMEHGTAGDIFYYDASGVPTRLNKPGSPAGEVLTYASSATIPSWTAPAPAGGLNFIATDVASNDSTLEVTLTGSYETYLITGSDLKPSNDSQSMFAQVGTSSAWTTGYKNAFHRIKSDATHDMSASNSQTFILLAPTVGNSTGEGCGFAIWIVQPRGASDVYPVIHGTMTAINANTIVEAGVVASMATSAVDLQRFKIYMSAGNLTSGRLTVWGLSHA